MKQDKYIKQYKKDGATFYRYEKTVYLNPKIDGRGLPHKRKFKKIKQSKFRTKSEAKSAFYKAHNDAILEIESRLMDEENIRRDETAITLRKAHEHTIKIGVSDGTKKKYDMIFKKYIEPYFDVDCDVSLVLTADTIGKWVKKLSEIFKKKQFQGQTVYLYFNRAKDVFGYALEESGLKKSIIAQIQPKVSLKRSRKVDESQIWSKNEIQGFLDSFGEEELVYKVFWSFMERGMRFNEVRGLKVSDIYIKKDGDVNKYKVNVERQIVNGSANKTIDPKSHNSKRTFYISEQLYLLVLELTSEYDLKKNEFLFVKPGTNSVINSKEFRKYFNKHKEQNVPDKKRMRPHHFRHRFATEAIKQKYSIISVARHLGDTIQVVHDTYLLPLQDEEDMIDV